MMAGFKSEGLGRTSEEPNASSERIGVYASRIFREFLASRKREVHFEDFSKAELDESLRLLFTELRQKDGTPYQVRSLNTIRYGISRTLKLRSPPIDINNDPAFRSSTKAFSDISRTLRSQGFDKGSLSNVGHAVISAEDIRVLYTYYWADCSDPVKLQQKVWFELELFSLSVGKEDAKQVKKTAFTVEVDTQRDRKYIVRNGKAFVNCAVFVVYEQPGSPYCPVASFERYCERLNPAAEEFFTVPAIPPEWYSATPYGNNILSLMKKISLSAGLTKKYANSSVRSTVSKLCPTVRRDGSLEGNIAFQDFFYGAVVGQEAAEENTVSPMTVYSNPPSPIELPGTLERCYTFEQVTPKTEFDEDWTPENEDDNHTPQSAEITATKTHECSCSSLKDLLTTLVQKQTEDTELRKRDFEIRQQELTLLSELVTVQKQKLEVKRRKTEDERKKSDLEDNAFLEFVKARLSKS